MLELREVPFIRDTIYPHFELLSLRGRDTDLVRLGSFFRGITKGNYKLIIIDGFYRLMPQGFDENSNADMTRLWNLLDAYAAMTGAAILVVHHSSKGDQSQKNITDVGSGAGAQSRAPDSHIVLRAHEVDDAAVLDGARRSFAPVEPLVIRYTYPLWELAPDLSPDDLRKPGGRRRKPEAVAPATPEPEPWTPERFVAAFITAEPATEAKIITTATLHDLSERQAKRLLAVAVEDRKAYRWADQNPSKPDRFASVEHTLIPGSRAKKRRRIK